VSVPARPIRVLLVEDNDVYRDSLVFLLGARTDLEVVGAEATGQGAVRRARELEPDVAVVDFRLPDIDGGTVAASVDSAVVFLSASAGEAEYDAASSAGAALVRKDEGLDALVGAIRAAAGR
jgi:DNA-binding NarL/FixJ family response regulator